MHELFATGKTIIDRLESNGFQGYFVGGCVRDHYMGRGINDVDITTDALPEEMEEIFERTVDVGKDHGTIIVLIDSVPFEVTTFRTESTYSDFRRPDAVVFTRDLVSDLERRDFTMNAMAMAGDFEIIDPYDGRKDISAGVIRTVGEARERFNEDALRILRAARFSSQLDFDVSDGTKNAMKQAAENIAHVATERTVVELRKLYEGTNPKRGKELLVETAIKKHLPFLGSIDDSTFLNARTPGFIGEIAYQIRLDPALESSVAVLKLSNAMKKEIGRTVELLEEIGPDSDARKIAYRFDLKVIETAKALLLANRPSEPASAAVLESAIATVPHLAIQSLSDIDLDGNALMQHFNRRGGKWIKETLLAVEQEILEEKLSNDREKILEWVEHHVEFEAGHIKIT